MHLFCSKKLGILNSCKYIFKIAFTDNQDHIKNKPTNVGRIALERQASQGL